MSVVPPEILNPPNVVVDVLTVLGWIAMVILAAAGAVHVATEGRWPRIL